MADWTHQYIHNCLSQLRSGVPLDYDETAELLVNYGDLLAKRDTLAAELATLRAGLPRWTRMDAWPSHWSQTRRPVWRLGYGEYSVISVSYEHGNVTQDERQRGDYASARKRAEALLGLPPCEVEGE